ncbi:hypothetical protein JOM56_015272, partial [Amanita muscaria]
WFAEPHTLIFLAFYLCLSKFYAISFMGSLNTRYHLRQGNESQNSQAWQLSASRSARVANASHSSSTTHIKSTEMPLQEVHVDVTESIQYDTKASSRF